MAAGRHLPLDHMLLAPVAGSEQPVALLAVDVSPSTTESAKWSTSGNGQRPLNTPTIAIVIIAGATQLAVAIVIVRRRTSW